MPLLGEKIRDIGYLAWKDEMAGLERMSGPLWENAIKEENMLWRQGQGQGHGHGQLQRIFEKELRDDSADLHSITFRPGWNPIKVAGIGQHPLPLGPHFKTFRATDDLSWLWIIRGDPSGDERCSLIAYNGEKQVWAKAAVGVTLAVTNKRCYYLRTERIHWHCEMRSCDAFTGDDDRHEFTVSSDQENLEIIDTRSGAIFVRVENSGRSALHWIPPYSEKLLPIVPSPSGWQVPIGCSGNTTPLYYSRVDDADYYRPSCPTMPALSKHERPLWGCSKYKTLIVRSNSCGGLRFYVKGKIIADYEVASYIIGVHGIPQEILIQTPTGIPKIYEIHPDGSWTVRDCWAQAQAFDSKIYHTRSQDGTSVSYLIIRGGGHDHDHDPQEVKHLLVYGYGAYGIPTFNGRVNVLWGPLLRRGWAVAYAMIRGGGDGSDAWAHAGRLTGRVHSIEDFEAVISAARHVLNVSAENTVIAGRSAGGLLVGASIVRNLDGRLFKGVFAEVPYVDILRTTTNPELPLTTIEYNEFGWPEKRVEDFATLLKLSPIDALPAEGAPRIFVLCRSGINDTQVLAYEPMKWIRHLRGVAGPNVGEKKLLALKAGQGHFYSTGEMEVARATDLSILSQWVSRKKNRVNKYKKMAEMMRKSRKERKERKSRKNMAGGKKTMKRKASRKATRKGRKATRKH